MRPKASDYGFVAQLVERALSTPFRHVEECVKMRKNLREVPRSKLGRSKKLLDTEYCIDYFCFTN